MHHMPEDAAAQDIPDSRHTWMKGMGLRHTEHELGTCVCCTNVCTAPVVDGVVEGGRIGRRGVEGGEPSSTTRPKCHTETRSQTPSAILHPTKSGDFAKPEQREILAQTRYSRIHFRI